MKQPEDNKILIIISKSTTQNKRANINCDDQLFVDASNLIKNNTKSFLSKVSLDRFSVTSTSYLDSCAIALSVEKIVSNPNFDYIIGVVFGALFIVVLISFFLYKRNQKIANIKQLPEKVAWAFKSAALDIFNTWEQTENYYHKELIPQSPEHNRVKNLFDNYLFGNNLSIVKISAVYNQNLVDAFVAGQTNWIIRLDDNQKLFQQNAWKDNLELREWVMTEFKNRVSSFPWNEGANFPILPACHGTDMSKAVKICNSGFASINTLDPGFYGKGIYVTSYAEYALRYAIGNNPCIIVAWILPGHPYPVIEHHESENTLKGGSMKPQCQSHYVRTDQMGFVFPQPRIDSYDEIVLAQENLIVPAFLLEFDFHDISAMQQLLGIEMQKQDDPIIFRSGQLKTERNQRPISSSKRNQLNVSVAVTEIMKHSSKIEIPHENEDNKTIID